MCLKGLHRFGLALWIALLALTAGGVAQNQLSFSVLQATLSAEPGHEMLGHYMPDGTFMAGPMAAALDTPARDGHTHKGHADCALCGVVASMAAIAVPVLDTVIVPDVFATPPSTRVAPRRLTDAFYTPYASRAPPPLIG